MAFFLLALLLSAEIAPTKPNLVYQQPQIASDGRSTGIVFGAKNQIYYSSLDSSPVLVADAPGLSLGNHRGPRIAFAGKAIVVSAGVGPANQEYGLTTVRSWRSIDNGKTWNPGPDLSTPTTGGMGFQAIGSDGKQRIWAAWIGPEAGHPVLYAAHSEDAGVTWSKQFVLSQTVCECCHPNVAISADGTVTIMFRNSLNGNRDFYLATSKDGKKFEMTKLGHGSWALNACPMDGGGLAESGGEVMTLWRREGDLFLARKDGGEEQRLAAGKNPSIALRSNGYYAVWSSPEGIMAKTPDKPAYVLSKTGAYPVISAQGPVIVAWEENGRIRSERLESIKVEK